MAPVAERNQTPYIIDVASADQISRQNQKWVFRLGTASSQFLSGATDFMEQVVRPKTMAIVYENTLFGNDTAVAVRKWAEKANVKLVNFETYEQGGIDFKPLLTKVKSNNPEVLFLVSYLMDASLLVLQSRELRLSPKIIIGAGAGVELAEFRDRVGIASEYVYSATLWAADIKTREVQEFVKRYSERYKETPTYHAAEGYAAIMVLTDALKRAPGFGKSDLFTALRATNLMTPFGRVTFTDFEGYTNQNKTFTLVAQWLKGRLQTVWPANYAADKYVFPMPAWDQR
jgi:branched-chain amino acid transport system substrate-binding protein